MALSTCEKCGNHLFSLQQTEPAGSSVKWYFVQCSSCGVPVGIVDFYPNSTVLKRIEAVEESIKHLGSSLSTVDHMLREIYQHMR